jgi:hypothetical protein
VLAGVNIRHDRSDRGSVDAQPSAATGAVASRLIGHDHLRHMVMALRQALEKAPGGFGIPPRRYTSMSGTTPSRCTARHKTPCPYWLSSSGHYLPPTPLFMGGISVAAGNVRGRSTLPGMEISGLAVVVLSVISAPFCETSMGVTAEPMAEARFSFCADTGGITNNGQRREHQGRTGVHSSLIYVAPRDDAQGPLGTHGTTTQTSEISYGRKRDSFA